MMTLIKPLLLFLGVSLLAACSINTAHHIVTIDETTPCDPLYIQVGQEVILTLPANPTTGFNWIVANQPDFLSFIKESSVRASNGNTPLVGTPTRLSWHYNVVSKGAGSLQMNYQRSWEKHTLPAKQYRCKVIAN